jgi:hypothetical protein
MSISSPYFSITAPTAASSSGPSLADGNSPYRLTDTAVRAVAFWVVPVSMRRYLPLGDVVMIRAQVRSTVGVLPRSAATRSQGSTVSRGSSPSP